MAEEIIDLRDRIEQMRIQIENEAVEQFSEDVPLEIHQQTSNSNISLSMENSKNYSVIESGISKKLDLPSAVKIIDAQTELLNNLKAKHVYQSKFSQRKLMTIKNEVHKNNSTVHPLVRKHPETGLKSLYINPIRIEKIFDLSEDQTKTLLDELMEYVNSLKFEYRHRWKVGDFVIWDNRALMHKANGDYDMNEKRYLYRVMIENDYFQNSLPQN